MSIAEFWAREELADIESRGLLRSLESLEGRQGAHVRIAGRDYLNFTSNDYLGLCGDERLVKASMDALERFGTSGGASRLLAGGSLLHEALETELASWLGAEAAVLFNTGYAANVGVLQALAGPEDVIFSDALNHASIVDGCRLSRAKVQVYAHADVEDLERRLKAESQARRRLVVTDSLFSMDGDRAPLRDLVRVCEEQGAALIVDEAHAIGVFGAGLCERMGLSSRVSVRVGTMGKSLGSTGAFAVASRALIDLFINRSRSLVFSTALSAPTVAAALEAVRIIRSDASLEGRLIKNVSLLASGLRNLGFESSDESPILPVVLGEPIKAVEASRKLREQGVYVKPIRPPTVPAGTSRLRFTLTAAHTSADIERALDAMEFLRK